MGILEICSTPHQYQVREQAGQFVLVIMYIERPLRDSVAIGLHTAPVIHVQYPSLLCGRLHSSE
jgi:hypothetical protein